MSENNPFQGQVPPQPQPKQAVNQIPVESVPLPSKGKIYPTTTNLANAETLDIRCMTAREEDLLTSRALLKNGMVIPRLIEACLIDTSISVGDMIGADRNAILTAIRITGYGSEYSVRVRCPACSEEFDNEFSLIGLPIKQLGVDPVVPNTNLFEYQLPMSKHSVKFKFLTGNDEIELLKESERKKKVNIKETPITSRLMKEIVEIEGNSDTAFIANYVNHMRAGDSRALRKYIDEIEPRVEMKQWTTCKACGEESEVNIPMGVTFLWPDLG